MAPPLFPSLPGRGWPLGRAPAFQGFQAAFPSGRELRAPANAFPSQDYTLTHDLLRAGEAGEFENLAGFYLSLRGGYGSFLYDDPADNAVAGQAVGVGDGATVNFAFQRTMGGALAPIGQVKAVSAVYVAGVALAPADYTVVLPASLVLATAPALGASVSADFSYYQLCRFSADKLSFAEFGHALMSLGQCSFRKMGAKGFSTTSNAELPPATQVIASR